VCGKGEFHPRQGGGIHYKYSAVLKICQAKIAVEIGALKNHFLFFFGVCFLPKYAAYRRVKILPLIKKIYPQKILLFSLRENCNKRFFALVYFLTPPKAARQN